MRDKVTLEDLKAKIASVEYIVLSDKRTTIAHVTLVNGFSVRGESSCVSESNYNKELGEKIALEKATSELWKLEGYLLAEEIYQDRLNDAMPYLVERLKQYTEDIEQDNEPNPLTDDIYDPVDRPEHYASADNGIECIDAIEAALGREQFIGFLRGQVIKYQWRMGKKDDAAQDNQKSIWYANKLAEIMKG